MSNTVERLNEILSEELDEFFEDNDTKLRPWGKKKWKENRELTVGDTCEWCGDTEGPFHVHHTGSGPNWAKEWIVATDISFGLSESFSADMVNPRDECPSCELRNYYSRKTKTPTYRCKNCEAEFDSPHTVTSELVCDDAYTTKKYVVDGFYQAKLEWLEDNRGVARDVFIERFEAKMNEYVSMNTGVVTICQSCHFQHEQTSNRRCSECGENWHKYNKEMCWDCLVEQKGLVECDCGDGWYQESKYDACSSCR